MRIMRANNSVDTVIVDTIVWCGDGEREKETELREEVKKKI